MPGFSFQEVAELVLVQVHVGLREPTKAAHRALLLGVTRKRVHVGETRVKCESGGVNRRVQHLPPTLTGLQNRLVLSIVQLEFTTVGTGSYKRLAFQRILHQSNWHAHVDRGTRRVLAVG